MSEFWKNKKIMAFIALAHHTRFIYPVMEELSRRGAKVNYIVGQAERSQEITAIKLGLNYAHVFDWLSETDKPDIQENYLRLRNALSKSLNTSFLYSSTPVTVIDKTIRAAAMEYVGFRNLVAQTRPDICFALHELNRWGKMFSFWAKKFNIPVLTFQEGMYYGSGFSLTGHVQHSTLNLAWGERVKKQLVGFEAPKDRILPVGNTHLADEKIRQEKNHTREKKRKEYQCESKLAILIVFSVIIPEISKLLPLFKAISGSPDKLICIKFHPATRDDRVSQWVESIPSMYKQMIEIFTGNDNLYNLLSMCDVIALTQASTTGLEALFFGKPLILLDVNMGNSFEALNVAVKMTPEAFGTAIVKGEDFNGEFKKENIQKYLSDELSGTQTAIETVISISEKTVKSSQSQSLPQLNSPAKNDRNWSIIIELPNSPEEIINQLEAVAVNSENSGNFEVVLIEPVNLPKASADVLDTLKGDVVRLASDQDHPLPERMNQAARAASGTTLVFLTRNMIPEKDWLKAFHSGIKRYKQNTIFGARILNDNQGIIHAGMIVDQNHGPVSAYRHLPADYPKALKERPFEMIDQVMAMNRKAFCRLGGFWEKSGRYAFMEICLRANKDPNNKNVCVYLPQACLVSVGKTDRDDPEGAIHFYGKWHGQLWQNQDVFYKNDEISKNELDTARLTRFMAIK